MTTRELDIRVNQSGNALSGLKSLASGLGSLAVGGPVVAGLTAITAGLAGITAVATGLGAIGQAGLSMNNSMEQATARINAFTKDSEKTAEILEMVRDRAAKTPFEFEAMAQAASALLPSAKMAQTGLEDLIGQAEILAASNPAEGLEGAAFALKEAVSGDFTSVIERFNLPRSYINQLKEEGVPNLEIVSRAMQEMGLDMDLVSALANTAQGRWSTLKDTFTNFASTITQPIFDAFSSGLGKVNDMLSQNEPAISRIAGAISGLLSGAINALTPTMGTLLNQFQTWVTGVTPSVIQGLTNLQGQFGGWATYLTGTVIPAVVKLAGSFTQNAVSAIPGILAAANQFWNFATSNLVPAFTSIWGSLQRIAAVFSETTGGADIFTTAVKAMELNFMPLMLTIKAIAFGFEWFATVVELANQAVKDIGAVFQQIGNIWGTVWAGIKAGLDVVIGLWQTFKDIVSSTVGAIPSLLIPGSPTPFEMGLRGIADATGEVSKGMSGAFDGASGFTPALPAGGAAGGAAGSGQVVIQLTYSPAVSLATEYELEKALETAWLNLARKNGVATSG
jgi:hypothetical protein